MRATYDQDADALMIYLADAEVEETKNIAPGVEVDFDRRGRVIAIEFLHASEDYDMDWKAIDAPSPYLSLASAAAICGLSPSTLKHQIHRGVLKGTKIGRDWAVHGNDIADYWDNHSRKAKALARTSREELQRAGRLPQTSKKLRSVEEEAESYTAAP